MEQQDNPLKGENKGNYPARPRRKIPKKITERYLHNAGLSYLQRFTASTEGFRAVMLRKIARSCAVHDSQNPQECALLLNRIIGKFQELKLLDDAAYAKGMLHSLRRRGLPEGTIRHKLLQKGLPAALIEFALKEERDAHTASGAGSTKEEGEYAAALRFAQRKKIGPFSSGRKSAEKELATLARAGFSYDIARKVLAENEQGALETLNLFYR